jgi:putative tryptophan/tyrosine transport system substrate-binding protein
MRRRDFITGIAGSAAAWPLPARAQQSDKMQRIGVLLTATQEAQLGAFRQALRELGWTEGGNVRIDIRWGEGEADRVSAYAAELIGMSPNVLVASNPAIASELRKGTRTIPIVFVQVPDPVELGLVVSLARPGGNVTGFTHFELAMGEKWLELLKEIAPRVRRVALLQKSRSPRMAWIPAHNQGSGNVVRRGSHPRRHS